jgi:hypothetical protein
MESTFIRASDFLEFLVPGEDILIEYHSLQPVHLLLYNLLKSVAERGKKFIILDELDQLHVFRSHMVLSGLDSSLIDQAKVIKFGGLLTTGNVIARIDLKEDPPIRKKRYEEILETLGDEKSFRIMLGLDKIVASYSNDPMELERIFGHLIRPHLGNPERVILYIVNNDIAGDKAMEELREHSTRVFQFKVIKSKPILEITKSIRIDEVGKVVSFD